MGMESLAVSEFKAKCIAKLKHLQRTGEELEITLRGKPIARVIPVRGGTRTLGGLKGLMRVHGDIISSDLDDDFSDAEAARIARHPPE
jgi:antitoxin (DNA-binding transcriptional repressor) of toxin-antitoxin stability system